MNKQLTVVFSIVILLTVTVVASVDLTQTADAAKAQGTSTPKYGSATKSQVCGDRLCSEIPPEERMNQNMQSSKQSPQMKMDVNNSNKKEMNQKHLQMLEDMKSMSKAEIIDSMKNMMSDHKDMMIEKMSKMDKQEMLNHMDKMIGKMSKMDMKKTHQKKTTPAYNETLNPRQMDYPNVLGFNDLHIHAIRHLDIEKSHGTAEHLLQTIVHHHCKVYDDNTASCLLFPYGMTDQDKPYGIEYVITTDQYQELPDEEKQLWHYHKTEFPRAEDTFPELTDSELAEVQPILDETYGKVFYFWNYGDAYPMGEPSILIVQDIPDQ